MSERKALAFSNVIEFLDVASKGSGLEVHSSTGVYQILSGEKLFDKTKDSTKKLAPLWIIKEDEVLNSLVDPMNAIKILKKYEINLEKDDIYFIEEGN